MKSVLNEMDPNERHALQSGSRKRKAPGAEAVNMPKNIQRKKVNASGRPGAGDSDSDDDVKAVEMMVRQRRNAVAKKPMIVDDDDSDEDEDDEESYDSDEIFGADDDSV
jgi:hypothetical protein